MLSLMAEQVVALRLEGAAAAAGDRVRAHRLQAKAEGGLTKTQLSWKISDHYPLWVEFSV